MPTRQRHILGAILIAGLAIAAFHILRLPRYLTDDAFISFRYARNLLDGHGLVFNPGERVEGYSNFLWVLLTTGGMVCRLEPAAWARAMGAIALFATVSVAARLAMRLTASLWAALATAVLLATSTALCASTMGGLETGLYCLLVTGAIASVIRGRHALASILMGLAACTRPEGLGLCIVAAAILWVERRRLLNRRRWFALIGPCALIVASLTAFRLAYFGDWLPNSVRAKSALLPLLREAPFGDWPGLILNTAGLRYVGDFMRQTFGPFVLFAVVPMIRCAERRWMAHVLLAPVFMGVTVAVYNFGDWMTSFRLLTPYLPLLTVAVVWGVTESARAFRQRVAGGRARRLIGWAATGAVVWCALNQYQWRRPAIRENPDVAVAALLANSRQPHLLAATDVLGRLGYYSGSTRILDMAGLTDRHIATRGRPAPPFGRSAFDYVISREPHLIMNNVPMAWLRRLDHGEFVTGYRWIDHAPWTRVDPAKQRRRFIFVRKDTVLERELRSALPGAVFRDPRAISQYLAREAAAAGGNKRASAVLTRKEVTTCTSQLIEGGVANRVAKPAHARRRGRLSSIRPQPSRAIVAGSGVTTNELTIVAESWADKRKALRSSM
ncbi:MAG: hypothetical protein ABII12_09730 [Planctomycetota bacterium]